MKTFAGYQDWGSDVQTWIYTSTPGESYYRIELIDYESATGERTREGHKYVVSVNYLSMHYVSLETMQDALACCGGGFGENEDCTPERMIEMLFDGCRSDSEREFSGNNYKQILQLAKAHVRRNVEE